ncbi:hypothetical protein PL79_016355 [Burkholderia sp. USMB20]|nr:hypothetical protein PL79_016355 [Burkholderia sp. USMB20]
MPRSAFGLLHAAAVTAARLRHRRPLRAHRHHPSLPPAPHPAHRLHRRIPAARHRPLRRPVPRPARRFCRPVEPNRFWSPM